MNRTVIGNILVSVKRHSVGLHTHLLSYVCKYLFVSFATFLSLACYEVKVGSCIAENLVDEVHDEFHILFYETT